VNIVNIGLQFNTLCFRYFLRRFQIRLFLIKSIHHPTHFLFPGHEKNSGPIRAGQNISIYEENSFKLKQKSNVPNKK
jgi:hypothetical protein